MSTGLSATPLLCVDALACALGGRRVLERIGFVLGPAERIGLFGPSGAGKSLILRALVGLAPPGSVLAGTLTWRADAPRRLSAPRELATLRGRAIALVPQDAAASLDPVRTVERQLAELVARHRTSRVPERLLELVALEPAVADARPAELSGGMAQRVAIAAAIACGPALLLADEPTAALDNLSQRHVLDALDRVCDQTGAALVLVSHDLAVLAQRCSRVLAVVDGEIVLDASPDRVLETELAPVAALVASARASEAGA